MFASFLLSSFFLLPSFFFLLSSFFLLFFFLLSSFFFLSFSLSFFLLSSFFFLPRDFVCCFTVSSGTKREQWKLRNGAVRRRQRSAEISSCGSDARCMARLVKGLLGSRPSSRQHPQCGWSPSPCAALQQGEGQVVQKRLCRYSMRDHGRGGWQWATAKLYMMMVALLVQRHKTDTRRRWSAQSLAVSADTQQMKQAPVDGYVAPVAEATSAAPAPVDECVAPFTEATFAAPVPVDEYVAPFHRGDLRSTCSRGRVRRSVYRGDFRSTYSRGRVRRSVYRGDLRSCSRGRSPRPVDRG